MAAAVGFISQESALQAAEKAAYTPYATRSYELLRLNAANWTAVFVETPVFLYAYGCWKRAAAMRPPPSVVGAHASERQGLLAVADAGGGVVGVASVL